MCISKQQFALLLSFSGLIYVTGGVFMRGFIPLSDYPPYKNVTSS